MSDLVSRSEALQRIIKERGPNPSEAATRVELIDQILADVLGWPRSDFHPEEYGGVSDADGKKKWLDYHLGSEGKLRLVVEAKRAGETFELGSRQQREVGLRTLRRNHGEPLADALKQAEEYCRQVGTLSFAVTNGYQWIASQAFVRGIPASKIKAVVFYDLDDMFKNLREFVDLLSPQGIIDQTLALRAGSTAAEPPPFARSLNDTLHPRSVHSKNYLIVG